MMQNGHMNGFPKLPGMSVPILGQQRPAASTQHWRCPNDPTHTFTGDAPAVGLPLNPLIPPQQMQLFIKHRICIFCVLEFLAQAFPVEEVTETDADGRP